MPLPMTAQVATVRHRISVPAKFQIASSAESTATRMHRLVIQKEILLTMLGLRNPRRGGRCSELDNYFSSGSGSFTLDAELILDNKTVLEKSRVINREYSDVFHPKFCSLYF